MNGLIAPPFALVNEARSGACPDGSIMRTSVPSGSVYWIPGDVVGVLGNPALSNPLTIRERLVGTTTPSALAMNAGLVFAATRERRNGDKSAEESGVATCVVVATPST